MSRPRSRRVLLATVATTVAATTGGFEDVSNTADTPPLESGVVPDGSFDCQSVTRPEPDAPVDDAALAPQPYPSPPLERTPDAEDTASLAVDQTTEYVLAFERAYRQNAFLARYGSAARTFELRPKNQRTTALESTSDVDAVMVALRYDLTTGTQQSVTGPRDQWDVHIVYYVDENILLRAQYDGVSETLTFEPDPRAQGTLVACFD